MEYLAKKIAEFEIKLNQHELAITKTIDVIDLLVDLVEKMKRELYDSK